MTDTIATPGTSASGNEEKTTKNLNDTADLQFSSDIIDDEIETKLNSSTIPTMALNQLVMRKRQNIFSRLSDA